MKRLYVCAAVMLGVGAVGSMAQASPFSDDLTRCMVNHTSAADNVVMVRWMFSEFALNPGVSDMTTVTPAARQTAARNFASVINRLLFTECRPEAVAALKADGPSVFEGVFNTMGRIAGRQMMSAPAVAADFPNFMHDIDTSALQAMNKEAGIIAPMPAK